MTQLKLTVSVLKGTFAICRLDTNNSIPDWVLGSFFSVTGTPAELSVVCLQANVPVGTRCEKGWCCLKIAGPLDFGLTGVLASLLVPLAQAAISVFTLSTYDTDYLMLRQGDLDRAVQALSQAGHQVTEEQSS